MKYHMSKSEECNKFKVLICILTIDIQLMSSSIHSKLFRNVIMTGSPTFSAKALADEP